MSFNLTTPETQDVEALKTLCDLVETFCNATMDIVDDIGVEPLPEVDEEVDEEAESLMDDVETALFAENKDAETLAALRFMDFVLSSTFEMAAAVEGLQEKVLTFVPQDLGSEVNANLIEKYELTGLAILAQRANGTNPSLECF